MLWIDLCSPRRRAPLLLAGALLAGAGVSCGGAAPDTGAPTAAAPDTGAHAAAAVDRIAGQARVLRVYDGDTLLVEIGGAKEKVRLLGVDAPEAPHGERRAQQGHAQATALLRELADDRVLRLEADPLGDDRDRYGRLLRHVILPDGRRAAEVLISTGKATAFTRFPFEGLARHVQLEREARAGGLGLWAPGGRPGIDWRDADDHMGRVVDARGRIVKTKTAGRTVFLDFHPDYEKYLSIVIFGPAARLFPEPPDRIYDGAEIIVTGRITPYRGRPQIVVNSPDQIRIVSAAGS